MAAALTLALMTAGGYALIGSSESVRRQQAVAEFAASRSPYKEPDPSSVTVPPGRRPADAFSVDLGSYERLFLRRHERVAIRVYRTVNRQTHSCDSGPCPPLRCHASGGVIAGVSTKAAVGNGLALLYDDPIIPMVATSGYIGTGENAPVAWTIIQLAKGLDAKVVRARFADGATDEMRIERGVAVLVHALPAGASLSVHIGDAEALDESGKVVASRELLAAPGPDLANQEMLRRPECKPVPPPLPEPNGPPPADEQRARDAVIQAYSVVYNGGTTDDEKAAVIDDPRGIQQAFETARRNFSQALANVTIRINEVKFLNPTEAAVAYDIVIPNYSPVPEIPARQGRAVLVAGTWRVARATICTDLELAAAHC